MHTRLDCVPCLLNQALKVGRLIAPENEGLQRQILFSWISRIQDMDLSCSPPELAGSLYATLPEIIGQVQDPFLPEKQKANQKTLQLLPELRKKILQSQDRLKMALHISIIGNYIDSGIANEYNWEEKLRAEEDELQLEDLFNFQQALLEHREILILGDNAGEIALDMLLVEELQKMHCAVTYAVRDKPVINDATLDDAKFVGMDKLCSVMSSGVDTPGLVLSRCSSGFLQSFQKAPVVLSKGQGNFEALSENTREIFYAFKVKCQEVSKLTGMPIGKSAFFLA